MTVKTDKDPKSSKRTLTLTVSPEDAARLDALVSHMRGLTSRSALARLALSRGLATLCEAVPTLPAPIASKPVLGPAPAEEEAPTVSPQPELPQPMDPVDPAPSALYADPEPELDGELQDLLSSV